MIKGKMHLRVKHHFDSAHKLNDYEGKCSNLHGHTWYIEVYIKVTEIGRAGISIDFGEVKSFLKSYLPDHKYLNEELDMRHPTAENIVMLFYKEIKQRFAGLYKVVLWETSTNAVEYSE